MELNRDCIVVGEDIVPHGKAARLLGVESKPTLHTKRVPFQSLYAIELLLTLNIRQ